MNIGLHLISMPWSNPLTPSIQLGALKAYVKDLKIPELDIQTYHAHFLIPFLSTQQDFAEFYKHCDSTEEYIYSLLYLREFGQRQLKKKIDLKSLLAAVNKSKETNQSLKKKISMNDIARLCKGTNKFIESYLVPRLSDSGINLIGFTLNHHQVVAAAYVMTYLKVNHSNRRFRFICGGTNAIVPSVVELFRKLDLAPICVFGEGEKKLESICRAISTLPPGTDDKILDHIILGSSTGVFDASGEKNLWVKDPEDYKGQIKDISKLPLPDYSDYFELLKDCCESEDDYQDIKSQVTLLIEGSRGCFAKCAFCGLNYLWEGFRRIESDNVLKRSIEMVETYGTNKICFVDNVCDTWAEGYAEELIKSKIKIPAFMEMRSHHPEVFWTKLALAGVNTMQIGVEALSPGILVAIGKGTRVIQNLAAIKYLTELKINSISNLITSHPGATVDDIKETKRVLELTAHFHDLKPSKFLLALGSPLFEKIPAELRPKLKPYRTVKFPKDLSFFCQEFWHIPPEDWVPVEVKKEWAAFVVWKEKLDEKNKLIKPNLRVERMPNSRVAEIGRAHV